MTILHTAMNRAGSIELNQHSLNVSPWCFARHVWKNATFSKILITSSTILKSQMNNSNACKREMYLKHKVSFRCVTCAERSTSRLRFLLSCLLSGHSRNEHGIWKGTVRCFRIQMVHEREWSVALGWFAIYYFSSSPHRRDLPIPPLTFITPQHM